MELLLIPLFLTVGAFYLENQVERRQERIASERYEQEAQIADERAKQETLTSYFEQMRELLLSENLRESSEDSEARSVARAITTTTIKELGSDRNQLLFGFLKESNLVQKLPETELETEAKSLALLMGLNLSGADFIGVSFDGIDLRNATLRGANLSGANLGGVDLGRADLRGADFAATRFGMRREFSEREK